MSFSEIVMAALAMISKSDTSSDYAAIKHGALEILKNWTFSVKRLYLLYCQANSIEPQEFSGYGLNDDFVYGPDFATAAATYVAMVLSPKTDRYKEIYDLLVNDICLMCGSDAGHIVEVHTV